MKKSILLILFSMFYVLCTIASNNIYENSNYKLNPVRCSNTELTMSLESSVGVGSSKVISAINMSNIAESTKVKKYVWIPWLYIAAGATAATGVYTYTKSNSIYNKYIQSSDTKESEQYHADVIRYDNISKIAVTATAGFAAVGIIVHVKHLKKKKSMSLSYIPVKNGAAFGLTYNF